MSNRARSSVASLAGLFVLPFVANFSSLSVAADPVKVFILAGQSNMEGKAKVSLLEYQVKQPETRDRFKHLLNDQDEWLVRNDVWIKFLDRKGGLTVGYGSPDRIGPELEFGQRVGDHFDEQILLIKTAWGGKSLFRDFRPPSAGLPDQDQLNELLEKARRKNPQTTMDDINESFGAYYRAMITDIEDTMRNVKQYFPEYQNQGLELAGFVWFQGWNDMVNDKFTAAYTENMIHFIRDVREDLDAPKLPFVIGQLGVGGTVEEKPNPRKDAFKKAQAKAGELGEFQGNVAVVRTDVLWDMTADAVYKKGWREHIEEWERVGSDRPYHYLGSPTTYCRIGGAFADAILDLSKR